MIYNIPLNAFTRILNKEIDFDTDTFKAVLLNGLTFDPDTHGNLAAVTANQIATLNGYTQNDKTLSGGTISADTGNDLSKIVWSTFSWTATEADDATGIGPFTTMAIYDDTLADKTIVAHVDFENTITLTLGVSLSITTPTINLTLG